MVFGSKTVASGWLTRAAIGIGVLLLAGTLYSLIRSSAQPFAKSKSAAGKLEKKQATAASEEPRSPTLQINSVIQHGRIFEIQGSTDPGAVVMINGETASTLFEGTSFKHFIGPLPSGTSIISVTSQDSQGGVNTQRMALTVQ